MHHLISTLNVLAYVGLVWGIIALVIVSVENRSYGYDRYDVNRATRWWFWLSLAWIIGGWL